jgi:hypothetical protein
MWHSWWRQARVDGSVADSEGQLTPTIRRPSRDALGPPALSVDGLEMAEWINARAEMIPEG